LEALRGARVEADPFAYFIVPRFVNAAALDGIRADFPAIQHPGSFPLSTLSFGPAFAAFMAALQSADMTVAVGGKLGIDLSRSPTMVTVRGQSRAADGKIHTDSRTKLVTALIYYERQLGEPQGAPSVAAVAARPERHHRRSAPGRRDAACLQQHEQCVARLRAVLRARRVIQLNWVTDESVVRREQARHRLSAFFKRLRGRRA
jgi:hypothetical protein